MRTTGDFGRRAFLRGAMGGAGLLALGGCATAQRGTSVAGLPFFDALPPLAPIRAHADRMFKITVCLRPFRAAGPRLDTETVGDKLVVHNYGHGGSGWSLSWGSGEIAVQKALAGGERDIAVIGTGALGLTAATIAQRAGANVTIYCKERLPDARSSRATGTWSPDSRVALESAAAPGFPALWEQMCRTSFKRYQTFLGLPGAPVEWLDRYNLSDLSPDAQREKRHRDDPIGFVNYQPMVRDLTPQAQLLPAGSHPFPAPYVQRNTSMMFNIPEYGRVLTEDFLMGGGRIVMREFHEPGELTSLKEKVIINCTGYGARALWRDESVVPVRGQIAWLIPQTEVTYGMSYKNVSMLSRRDGIVMQYGGPNEGWGYNSTDETPHRDEAEIALAAYQELYAKMTAPRGLQVAAPVRS